VRVGGGGWWRTCAARTQGWETKPGLQREQAVAWAPLICIIILLHCGTKSPGAACRNVARRCPRRRCRPSHSEREPSVAQLYAEQLAPQRVWPCHPGPVAINVYEIVKHQGEPRSSTASPCHLIKRCISPPTTSSTLCVDALSGDVNHWRWIDAGRWPNQTVSSRYPQQVCRGLAQLLSCEQVNSEEDCQQQVPATGV
jgi:hypothetical protein